MNNTALQANKISFDQALTLALRLPPLEQARLVARLAPKVEVALEQAESLSTNPKRTPLRGLLADLGPAPSGEDIDEVQRELWAQLDRGA